MTDLAAALLRDVPRYDAYDVMMTLEDVEPKSTADGGWVRYSDVLAALSRALDPAIAERAGEVLERLQKADEYEPLGHDGWDAADLITALLAQNAALRAERDEALEWLSASQGYIADAVFALDKQEKAEAERDALRAERDGWKQWSENWRDSAQRCLAVAEKQEARATAAEAREERLRGAMANLATELTGVIPEPENMRMAIDTAVSVARAALTTEADNG